MSKEIVTGDSTLLALKAELLSRKQTVSASGRRSAKSGPLRKPMLGVGAKDKESKSGKRAAKESKDAPAAKATCATSESDAKSLALSRKRLEAKALLYEKLQSGELKNEIGDSDQPMFLVDFDRKRGVVDDDDDVPAGVQLSSTSDETVSVPFVIDNKPSLPVCSMLDDMPQADPSPSTSASVASEADTEKGAIHYQHLSYEPRVHGVGYFKFAADEAGRAQQMAALDSMRDQTLQQRDRANQLKQKREDAMAKRLANVRARKGLPPEEPQPPPKPKEAEPEADKTAEAELEQEKRNELRRLSHVRPWDKEKEPMSQDEWVAKQRKERKAEFAPPSTYG